MDQPLPQVKHAAANRIVAAALGIGVTTLIGGAGVMAVYYPLRHAHFAVQWALVFLLMAGESAAIHLPSEVILPVGGWLIVREHDLGPWGLIGLSLIAAAGNTAGSSLLYAAGRAGGRPLVRRYGRWVLLHEADVDAAEARCGTIVSQRYSSRACCPSSGRMAVSWPGCCACRCPRSSP